MGVVNIDDQLRKASTVSCRSINAQAAFWIRMGMLCEMNPTQNFNDIVARELRAAGVSPPPTDTPPHDQAARRTRATGRIRAAARAGIWPSG